MADPRPTVVPYQEDFRPAFEQLNRDWIESYFVLEDADRAVFADPAGAAFCVYTDGLVDRHNDPTRVGGQDLRRVAEQVFGELGRQLPGRPPAAEFLAENIVRDMLGGAAPDDDVCLAVLHVGPDAV